MQQAAGYNPNLLSQNFNARMNQHYNVQYSQHFQYGARHDIQCGDISQSTQVRKNKQNQSKADKKPTAPVDKVVDDSKSFDKSITIESQDKATTEPKKSPSPDKPNKDKTTKTDKSTDSSKNNYMKNDTYQRTLMYVQQCQSWNTGLVKDEVSSTTDHKNSEKGSKEAKSTVPNGTPCIIPSSNMVLNNLSSSMSALQHETKYFQMLQWNPFYPKVLNGTTHSEIFSKYY